MVLSMLERRLSAAMALCHLSSEQISRLVLDSMESEDPSAFESHLKECPYCRQQAEPYRRVVDILQGCTLSTEVPPSLKTRVLCRASARPRPRLQWLHTLLAAALGQGRVGP